jgi:hypothetical protein
MNAFSVSNTTISEKYELALSYIDEIILLCPDYEAFLIDCIISKVKQENNIKVKIIDAQKELINLLVVEFQYIETNKKGASFYNLSDKGRTVKAAGGHFLYQKQLAEKAQKEQERQNRKDRIDYVDFLMKSWSYKYRYLLYIASFGGLVVAIFTYFKPEKEPKDLAPMKQELQEVKSKTKELDSLFRMDRLLKKDTIDIRRHQ